MTEVWMSDFLLYFCVFSQEGHADTENVAAAIDTYNGISVSTIWRVHVHLLVVYVIHGQCK